MTGPLFTPAYIAHVAHIIKQADESRAAPVTYADDAELFAPLRPSTIYMVRIMIFLSGTGSGTLLKPMCTQTVDWANLWQHRSVATNSSDFWFTGSANNHQGGIMNTARFNGSNAFAMNNDGARRITGMIKTGSAGGTFSVKWGTGANSTRIVHAGSFMLLQEATEY